jgi:hypothetical protein
MISTIGRLSKEEADLLLQENARRWSHLWRSQTRSGWLVKAEEEERERVVVEDHPSEVADEPIVGDRIEHGGAGLKAPSSTSATTRTTMRRRRKTAASLLAGFSEGAHHRCNAPAPWLGLGNIASPDVWPRTGPVPNNHRARPE